MSNGSHVEFWSHVAYTAINVQNSSLYKTAKIIKRWYCPHDIDCVSMCCWIISPFYDFCCCCGHELDLWGHVTSSVTWPFDSPWGVSYRWSVVTIRLSGKVNEIFSLEDNGVTTLTFGVTWRHRSRDHSTPHLGFPIRGQWSPSVYLARLLRYSA